MKKTACFTRFFCLLFVLSMLLISCSSVYEHMPETTDAESFVNQTEEYFTTGNLISFTSNLGIEYEGQWIYVEDVEVVVKEDNPNTSVYDPYTENHERLVKYNPATKTVSSLCLDPACLHSSEECPFFAPYIWMVSYYEVFGDWLIYTFGNYFADDNEWDTVRSYLYNLKTGERRQLQGHSKAGELMSWCTTKYVMNGKIYSTMLELDYSGEEEFKTLHPNEEFIPETHQYVDVYDPNTDAVERLCEISDDLLMFCISNKRFFFKRSDNTYWSSDYNGENMKQENVLITDAIQLCGKYAYIIESEDFSETLKNGSKVRAYDLETDSIVTVSFNDKARNIMIDSGKIAYTTFSKIDDFKLFALDKTGYVKKLYPDETNAQKISQLTQQIRNSLQYDGTFQIYVTDALGNNKKLAFEGENMNIKPLRMVGNYLFGYVSYADPNNNFAVTYPGNGGRCALNLETGEITLIPQLELYLD